MKLKAQQVWDAMMAVIEITNRQAKMTQKGKYRLARLHSKLSPEFDVLNVQRNTLIESYKTHEKIPNPAWDRADELVGEAWIDSPRFVVPLDKLQEFNDNWKKQIADEEIDLDFSPIPIELLSLGDDTDGSIQVAEIIALGELVTGD